MAKKINRKIDLSKKVIVRDNPLSPISEQYRGIRTNIEFANIDRDLKVIVCSSPSPGEGKSTTIANLAVAFAGQEKNVLLIDADLRRPTLQLKFTGNPYKGLTNILVEKLKIEDVARQTEVDNLWLINAGTIPPNPAELLGSNAMKDFLENAKTKFDIILIDTPPILAVTDARILAKHADGFILVVRSGHTKKHELALAKEQLDQAQINIIGTILHGVAQEDTPVYYYGRGS